MNKGKKILFLISALVIAFFLSGCLVEDKITPIKLEEAQEKVGFKPLLPTYLPGNTRLKEVRLRENAVTKDKYIDLIYVENDSSYNFHLDEVANPKDGDLIPGDIENDLQNVKSIMLNGKVAKTANISYPTEKWIFFRTGNIRIKAALVGSEEELIKIAKSIK